MSAGPLTWTLTPSLGQLRDQEPNASQRTVDARTRLSIGRPASAHEEPIVTVESWGPSLTKGRRAWKRKQRPARGRSSFVTQHTCTPLAGPTHGWSLRQPSELFTASLTLRRLRGMAT